MSVSHIQLQVIIRLSVMFFLASIWLQIEYNKYCGFHLALPGKYLNKYSVGYFDNSLGTIRT